MANEPVVTTTTASTTTTTKAPTTTPAPTDYGYTEDGYKIIGYTEEGTPQIIPKDPSETYDDGYDPGDVIIV